MKTKIMNLFRMMEKSGEMGKSGRMEKSGEMGKSLKSLMQIFATYATYASAIFVGKESNESTVRYALWSRISLIKPLQNPYLTLTRFRLSLGSNLSRSRSACAPRTPSLFKDKSQLSFPSLASLICLCMLTVGVGNVRGANIVIDLDLTKAATYPDGFPTSSGSHTSGTHTFSGYSFSFSCNTDYYRGSNGGNYYILIGKAGTTEASASVITFPAIADYKLTEVKLTVASSSGENVAASIRSNWATILSGGTSWTFDAGQSNTWTLSSTAANTAYKMYIIRSSGDKTYNGQLAGLKLTYEPAAETSVEASPTSITFDNNTLSGGEASGSKTVTISVSNGNKSSGNYLYIWPETDEEYCEFYVNNGEEIYSSGNSTTVSNLSVEYFAIEAGTFTGNLIAQGYNSSYVAVNCTIPLSVTVAAPACANSVSIATGSQTNCTLSASAASVSTCSGTRQVTISVTPNSCYAAPEDASIISKSGTTATLVSGPTLNAGHYDYVYSFAENATGTATFNASLSTKTSYTVQYNAGATTCTGGNAITGSKANDTKTCGTNLTLPDETFHTTGYTQTGWTKTPCGSQTNGLGGTYSSNAAQTFYPVWTPNNYTVTWKVNNENYSAGGSSSVTHGNHIATLPSAPNPPTYGCGDVFVGWTDVQNYVHGTSPLYTTAAEFPNATGDQVFYAVYADYTTE